MKSYRMRSVLLACTLVFAVTSVAAARGRFIANNPQGGQPGQGGMVNLPYQVQDNQGTTWMLYGSGWLQQQGNMPVFSQAAILQINQNQHIHDGSPFSTPPTPRACRMSLVRRSYSVFSSPTGY